jgi:hypothetical protein
MEVWLNYTSPDGDWLFIRDPQDPRQIRLIDMVLPPSQSSRRIWGEDEKDEVLSDMSQDSKTPDIFNKKVDDRLTGMSPF